MPNGSELRTSSTKQARSISRTMAPGEDLDIQLAVRHHVLRRLSVY